MKKNNKASFTLVELSVVLLVLSVLIGGLLVGRSIVDRARVQRIVQEVDFYKKAITMFTDQYGQLPGNLEPSICEQHDELSSTGVCSLMKAGSGSFNVISATGLPFVMRHLKFAGLIENVNGNASCMYWNSNNVCSTSDADYQTYWSTYNAAAFASFDNNTAISLVQSEAAGGWIRGGGAATLEYMMTSGVNIVKNSPNVLVLYNNVASTCTDQYGSGCQEAYGAFTAAIAKSIDVKYDDGKPYTGNIL